MIHRFLEWVQATPWSIALLESYWVWPLVESTHVLSLALFVGTTAMMDLRLLGVALPGVPVSHITRRMLPWTHVGFVFMVTTGLLLLYSNPVRYYHNLFFRIKLVLLVVAGLNAWFFHVRIHRSVDEWDLDRVPPPAARRAAVVSLLTWAAVVVTGRFIAYNWFDCDIQPQPEWVNVLSGCVLPPGGGL